MRGALADYVYGEDDHPVYEWYVYKTEEKIKGRDINSYWLNLTSQRWSDGKPTRNLNEPFSGTRYCYRPIFMYN